MTQTYTRKTYNRLKRAPGRASYDEAIVHQILDANLICHVGYEIDGQPFVTPTSFWREENRVYWHGAAAGRMLKHQKAGVKVCFTVSQLDGLVMARSAFHHSLNYQSVMAFGTAYPVVDRTEKNRQLELFMDRLAPGRWDEVRPPNARELRLTTVMELVLDDVVAKVRNGPPVDNDEDHLLDCWAGIIPFHTATGAPMDDPQLRAGILPAANLRQGIVSLVRKFGRVMPW
ncbi:MAG: pyridoxamine 5'-phosphate oxidase family protein [Pseudomonadales bacterium]|nr:pyridoxamine 5'-phosphate oxidase family protein [Pseudomonadales bacterium]